MTHEEFKNKYLGQLVDWDGVASYQCADIAKAYASEVWGVRVRPFGVGRTHGGVINAFYNYPNSFIYADEVDLIVNEWGNVNQIPRQGDIVIWGDYELTNHFGHIAVVDVATTRGFASIDQNWGPDLRTRIVNHDYRGVLGWLRPKQQINNNLMNQDKLIQSINNNAIFDQATKDHLIQAVRNDDADYLLAFSGSAARSNVAELKQKIEALENKPTPIQATVVAESTNDKFDNGLLWLGRLKSYLRSNVDKAVLVSSLTPVVIALNERYQLGMDNGMITSAVLGFAAFLVSIGAIGEKLNK